MNKELISFETAKLAFEKGFIDVQTLLTWLYYEKNGRLFNNEYEIGNEDYICSTQSELQTWLREKHGVDLWVEKYPTDTKYISQCPILNKDKVLGYYDTYEEALEKALVEALNFLEL